MTPELLPDGGQVAVLAFAVAGHAPETGAAVGWESILLRGYLIAWLFWLGVCMGGQVFVWLHDLTGGAWGRAIRPECEAAGRTLPLLAVGFLPIAFNLQTLYVWARPEVMESDPLLQRKADWLNADWFWIRAGVYFVFWLGMQWSVRLQRRRARIAPTMENERRVRTWSAASLLVYGLTMTFAAIDWAMSLEPHWFSGIYGVIVLLGQALSGLALGVAVASRRFMDFEPREFPSRDLGNLLLAFTMLWTYVSFSQFLIIWSGDLPEEVIYYTHREAGGWRWLMLVLFVLHFCVPFLVLLSREVKEQPRLIGMLAIWLLLMRWADVVWLVEPAFAPSSLLTLASHFVVMAAVGCLWWLCFWWMRSRTLREWPTQVYPRAAA